VAVAAAAVGAGATGLTLINTVLGLAIDAETRWPRLGAGGGGLSGPAIKPVALRAVADVARALPGTPIIGTGGVRTGLDAVEMLLAGASAVGVGTATFFDPRAAEHVAEELARWCQRHGLARSVFRDLKLHDTPATVGKAARQVGRLGVGYVTLHTAGGVDMLRAGVEGLEAGAAAAGLASGGGFRPVALGVTVLTSDPDASAFPARLAAAVEGGCGGVVCSVRELPAVLRFRATANPRARSTLLAVVPG